MDNKKVTILISQSSIIEHLKKSVDDPSHIEKFHEYLELGIFEIDVEVLYENEFVLNLYNMLLSYFISFVSLNQESDYKRHFSSLIYFLEQNLSTVEHVSAALCYDDFSKLIQKFDDGIITEVVLLGQLQKRFPDTDTDSFKILQICRSGLLDRFWK